MADSFKQTLTQGSQGAPPRPRAKMPFLPFIALPRELPPGRVPIADMANAFGVTHRTLHFYEEKGLISSSRIGLMRVYDASEVMQMAVINVCRETGMAVAVIQELMNELCAVESQHTAEAVFRSALAARKRELSAEMSTLHRQLQQVAELLDSNTEDDGPHNDNAAEQALTDQELRCLALMAEGLSTQKIGRHLDLNESEAKSIEASIITKLRANNRFQAITKAVLLGVVQV